MKPYVLLYLSCIGLLITIPNGAAETRGVNESSPGVQEIGDAFTFVRVQYDSAGGSRDVGDDWGWGAWRTWAVDFPASDRNFLRGVRRLTNIQVNQEPIVLRLDDDRIFEYPFLYMLEVGRQGGLQLRPKEVENLREYLLRGGFLFIDDFWGTWQWANFYATFATVFPDREIVELAKDHPIFRSYYDIDGPQMIPRIYNFDNQPERDVDVAINRAVLDDDGRVMVLINWNSDIGDGWEHTYHPEYPTQYANMAYRLGINYLIYALTH
ncbi:MAG: DUF4159 domain-containing protein [Desulfosarcinaceae bacterium]|nr:DUF4159 domain-containing protein [Desulfosarcinaceae bacterium]